MDPASTLEDTVTQESDEPATTSDIKTSITKIYPMLSQVTIPKICQSGSAGTSDAINDWTNINIKREIEDDPWSETSQSSLINQPSSSRTAINAFDDHMSSGVQTTVSTQQFPVLDKITTPTFYPTTRHTFSSSEPYASTSSTIVKQEIDTWTGETPPSEDIRDHAGDTIKTTNTCPLLSKMIRTGNKSNRTNTFPLLSQMMRSKPKMDTPGITAAGSLETITKDAIKQQMETQQQQDNATSQQRSVFQQQGSDMSVDALQLQQQQLLLQRGEFLPSQDMPIPPQKAMFHKDNFASGYNCKVCGKTFPVPSKLEVHQRTHTGEKPFKCSICNKSFAAPWDLKTHTKGVHLNVRPYKCDVCNKSFGTAGNLKVHQRIHSGEKPYECAVCYKKFTDCSTWSKHVKSHSDEQPYTCEVCGVKFKRLDYMKHHRRTKHELN